MKTYRRGLIRNARIKALRQVRRHAWETEPWRHPDTDSVTMAQQAFKAFRDRLNRVAPVPLTTDNLVLSTRERNGLEVPADCPDCCHPHKEEQECDADFGPDGICGCTA